jgi:hypothetical protein
MNTGNKFIVTAIGAGLFALVLIGMYTDFGANAVGPEMPADQGSHGPRWS